MWCVVMVTVGSGVLCIGRGKVCCVVGVMWSVGTVDVESGVCSGV